MKKKLSRYLTAVVIVSMISLLVSTKAQAGSKDLEATKKAAYQDDSTESMRVVNLRLEAEKKERDQKILSNSEKSVKLLTEIRDLLQKLNEKE